MAGLAESMAAPQGAPAGGMPTVDDIAAMLMQGANPDELVAMGIPEQLIMEAIAMLEQQMNAQAAPPAPAEPEGLAQSMMRQ